MTWEEKLLPPRMPLQSLLLTKLLASWDRKKKKEEEKVFKRSSTIFTEPSDRVNLELKAASEEGMVGGGGVWGVWACVYECV